MKKKYQSKRELQIDLFFDQVNWYEIIKCHWQICKEWNDTQPFITNILANEIAIKKTWLDNPHASLPTVLSMLDVIPTTQFARSKKLMTRDHTWVVESLEDLMDVAKIPYNKQMVCRPPANIFGIKKKNPKYMLISKLNPIERFVYLR